MATQPTVENVQMQAQFSFILQDAAKQYSDSWGTDLEEFTKIPIASVDDLIYLIDVQNIKFSHFRDRKRALFHGLHRALKPVEVVGGILAGAAENLFKPTQGIYFSVMTLINAAHDVSTIYDAIIELFRQLEDFAGRLEVYVKYPMSPALRKRLVDMLAALFRVFVLSTKEARGGRAKAFLKRLGSNENPVQSALDKLNKLAESEERQALTDGYGLTHEVNERQKNLADIMTQVSEDVQSLRFDQEERATMSHQDRLREILKPSPFPEDTFQNFNRWRVEGTGDWIINDEGFNAWLSGETRFLWITGSSGTGKSYLVTRLISWGRDRPPNMAFFYFRVGNPETRSVLQALRDVAYQLSSNDAFYARQLTRLIHSSDELKTVSGAFRRLFVEPLEGDTRPDLMYVFLDGIDEAETEQMEQLLQQLGELGSQDHDMNQGPRIQFALVGRSFMDTVVPHALAPHRNAQVATISISPDRTCEDVDLYIHHEVMHKSLILGSQSAEFKQKVIRQLQVKVAGLFILAKFMISIVNSKRHASSILSSLEEYPNEINSMLQATLEGLASTISDDDAADLNEMLRWMACAEQTLTLEQLEVILIMSFGDPPLRLEESLRGQYACFFELEREDGLSTDDLIKQHERQQRQMRRETSPNSHGSPNNNTAKSAQGTPPGPPFSSASPLPISPKFTFSHTAASSPTQSSPKASLSHATTLGGSTHSSPTLRGASPSPGPGWPFSPPPMKPPVDGPSEVEFKSNKSTTSVSFFHTTVRNFFRETNSVASMGLGVLQNNLSTIGFDTNDARLHIVATCLRIFTERDWFAKLRLRAHGREAIKQYAAWYWQEHLVAFERSDLSPKEKRDLGFRVYQMLTEKEVILDWTMMYEKNNEGLEIFSDKNIQGLQRWFSRPRFLASLDFEGRQWALKASKSASFLTERVGRIYAAAWLSKDFDVYIPTVFCFKIVSSVAYLASDLSWTRSSEFWSDKTISERITLALQWAGYPETAHWHRRVGSTYLMLSQHNNALHHYYKALELDHNSTETSGRIAYCLTLERRYEDALDMALGCVTLEEAKLADQVFQGSAKTRSQWRLYKDNLLIAKCYYHVKQHEESFEYFRKAIDQAAAANLRSGEAFEPWIAFLEVLAAENRHGDVMRLVEDLATRKAKHAHSQNLLTDLLMQESNKALVLDWLPRATRKAGKADFFLSALESAITTAHTRRNPLTVLHLRLSLGATLTYNLRFADAIEIYEQISFYEYRAKGNIPTRQGHAVSFQKLAILYNRKVLNTGLDAEDQDGWQQKLYEIQVKQAKHQNNDMPPSMLGSDINMASIFIALFARLRGREREANALLKELILDSFDILSDSDPANDEYALDNLVRIFIAADDVANARALAHSMRKINPLATMSTPSNSPVRVRALEPKLPDIQSSQRFCAQCLDNIFPSESFAICRFCLEFFCSNCLQNIIRVPNNRTEDHREDIICKSDHLWIDVPPLNRFLHRGEIWFEESGGVQGFTSWKESLKKMWEARSPLWERTETGLSDGVTGLSQDSQSSY